MSSFSSTVYDEDEYNDVPEYKWDNTFDALAFAREIEQHNNTLFENLKQGVCEQLQLPLQRTGCKSINITGYTSFEAGFTHSKQTNLCR